MYYVKSIYDIKIEYLLNRIYIRIKDIIELMYMHLLKLLLKNIFIYVNNINFNNEIFKQYKTLKCNKCYN